MKKLALLSIVALMVFAGCNGANNVRMVKGTGTLEDPVMIPYIEQVQLDGQTDEWALIGPMPLPHMDQKTSNVKLAWNESGLYGMVMVPDEKVETYSSSPWEADAFELWLDKGFERTETTDMNDGQYAFAPDADKDEGKAVLAVPYGSGAFGQSEELEGYYTKTDTGWLLEFRVPEKIMSPAKLKGGTKIGIDFAIDNGGEPVVQFYNDKQENNGFANPSTWGAASLCPCGMKKE
jgi:hypothetical protein